MKIDRKELKNAVLKEYSLGKTITELSKEYSLPKTTVSTWVNSEKKSLFERKSVITEKDYKNLVKENKILKEENEILKKAMGIFTKTK